MTAASTGKRKGLLYLVGEPTMVGRTGDVPTTVGSWIRGGLPPGPVQGKGGESQ